jgi:hypothetical protein
MFCFGFYAPLLLCALPSKNRLNNAVLESRKEADPPSRAGTRGVERSETRMSGALSLWLLSARVKGHAANQVTRRGPKQTVSAIDFRRLIVVGPQLFPGAGTAHCSVRLKTAWR